METSIMKILPKQPYSNSTKTSLKVTSNERPRSLFASPTSQSNMGLKKNS